VPSLRGLRLRARGSDAATETAIRVALSKGDAGMHKIAARLGVGTGTVQQIGDRSRLRSIAGRTGATGAGAAGGLRQLFALKKAPHEAGPSSSSSWDTGNGVP
jgi:hypothetical protein